MTELVKEQFRATDEPTKKDYLFDDFETIKHADPEYAEWSDKVRPRETFVVQNQWQTPACTAFSNGHIYNGNNIIEDKKIGESRPQVNPANFRNKFCELRGSSKTGTSIQTMAKFYKDQWLIEWFVTIRNSETDLVKKMRKAIDNGNFLATGSSNGDRATIKKTGVYSVRKDDVFVWHARCIVSYEDDFFRAINSWGNRGIHGGYFKVPNDMVDKVYSKLAIIDKDDSIYFQMLRDKIKAEEMKTIWKYLYSRWNSEVKSYFEKIQLSTNLDRLYK